jgi:hypothetical protein
MAAPWNYNSPVFTVYHNEAQCFKLFVPYRGTITRFVITQESGAPEGFTLNLFNTREACPPGPGGSLQSAATEPGNAELYKIFPTQTAAPAASYIRLDGVTYLYQNIDGTPCDGQYALYAQIDPNGAAAGQKTFRVQMTIKLPEII